jgi:hypothetical protein
MQRLKLALSFVAAVSVVACSGVKYRSDFDPQASFSGFNTYSWADRTPTGDDDPRVYNDIVDGRIKLAADRALEAKGYRKVTDNPDFYVAWHGAIDGKMNVTTINSHYGYGWGWYGYGRMGMGASQTYVNEWDEGTLLIDVIDGGTNNLVWRGTATAELRESRSADEAQRRLDDILANLFDRFPPQQ